MKSTNTVSNILIAFVIAMTLACSNGPPKAPDVKADIQQVLDQAGLDDVSVSQVREKSVVTLRPRP